MLKEKKKVIPFFGFLITVLAFTVVITIPYWDKEGINCNAFSLIHRLMGFVFLICQLHWEDITCTEDYNIVPDSRRPNQKTSKKMANLSQAHI